MLTSFGLRGIFTLSWHYLMHFYMQCDMKWPFNCHSPTQLLITKLNIDQKFNLCLIYSQLLRCGSASGLVSAVFCSNSY